MSEAKLLDGKAIAQKYQTKISQEFAMLYRGTNCKPKMVAIKVHDDQASELYLKSQKRSAEAAGVIHETVSVLNSSQNYLIQAIRKANQDSAVHGIIIQMPLPQHFNLEGILDSIDPKKDIEGITSFNLGQLVLRKNRLVPCTALSCMTLIEETGVPLRGKEAVIVGSSKVVGRPAALLLLDRMATATVCHIATTEAGMLESHVKRADILVVGVGKPGVIPGDWIKPGAIVIDVGINRINGKTVGDVEFETAKKKAGFLSPVPGGVGPLTVTILMRNLLTAYRWQLSDKTVTS
ncbi:MAG: bifunctional 5,10-methylene-tetrahydrofolate dehydrogenase/5,10-methylene-tetrahydrofolate cyclohydrolase [Candidatus Omnitrophica bacterium CG11_big_fil_rev_8_21_14_0_20_45_26]|uniref:Bifunctional protein FolD n=1 Tax=Candidatus Abzuiibacterium crystallinum TaxID=1974748 RepID=A0A2H0LKY9_9BACT|nr:MAG: bifunctional 5,10-methylene-tetrahydrofolate dehydrogenase/5,10-methylene-tetrahydrofolate cyclohydrolase [Candidatus Omnitrophica bacterium CG11_big_fil_rev_8_21_14_0_20_45_26]PIW63844.1 MAG: bifunctional 5,10-methylene-tetrahydrofolate dehydrogenase/5,10-methylene-tetrahydrofolate cyclohydrolase [Candidatus Omnitrophica bacterium CG12_big_fil_rev_8_21_14_0_65_45_16]